MKRPKTLLLATAALTTAIGCGGKKKQPELIYSNPKGGRYDQGLVDAGTDAPPPPDDAEGSFHDDGLAKPPG